MIISIGIDTTEECGVFILETLLHPVHMSFMMLVLGMYFGKLNIVCMENESIENLDVVFHSLRLNRFDAKYFSSHVRKIHEIFIHTEKISRSSAHIAMIENDSLDIFILSQVFV